MQSKFSIFSFHTKTDLVEILGTKSIMTLWLNLSAVILPTDKCDADFIKKEFSLLSKLSTSKIERVIIDPLEITDLSMCSDIELDDVQLDIIDGKDHLKLSETTNKEPVICNSGEITGNDKNQIDANACKDSNDFSGRKPLKDIKLVNRSDVERTHDSTETIVKQKYSHFKEKNSVADSKPERNVRERSRDKVTRNRPRPYRRRSRDFNRGNFAKGNGNQNNRWRHHFQ